MFQNAGNSNMYATDAAIWCRFVRQTMYLIGHSYCLRVRSRAIDTFVTLSRVALCIQLLEGDRR